MKRNTSNPQKSCPASDRISSSRESSDFNTPWRYPDNYVEGHPYCWWMVMGGHLRGIHPNGSGVACKCIQIIDGVIPEDVKVIGNNAFRKNAKFRKIDLPIGVTNINDYAFYESCIEDITFPRTIKYIDNFAFAKCRNLKKIECVFKFQSGVHLGYWCFANCENLEEVYLKVSIVPGYCFYNCKRLRHLHLINTTYIDLSSLKYEDEYGVISNIPVTLYAPKGSYVERFAKKNGFRFVEEKYEGT